MYEHYKEVLAKVGTSEAHIKLDDFLGYEANA
jgi:hypothetical protein